MIFSRKHTASPAAARHPRHDETAAIAAEAAALHAMLRPAGPMRPGLRSEGLGDCTCDVSLFDTCPVHDYCNCDVTLYDACPLHG
jgi:hypothetical protein